MSDDAMALSVLVERRMAYRDAAVFMNRFARDMLVLVRQVLDRVRGLQRSGPDVFGSGR